jgi:hypothetical protein
VRGGDRQVTCAGPQAQQANDRADGHPDPSISNIRAEVTLGNKIVLSSINREKCGTHIGVNCREMSDGWRRVIMLVSRLQLQTCKLDHGSKYVQIKKGQIRPGFLPLLFCQTLCLCDQLPDPHRKSSASNSNSKKISYYISIKSNKKSSLISREIIKINIYT